ncbi:MAG: addiction module protein [Planctomycetes bacterium]|nr:addiction module protein [Planctomycetota bacterium]
MSLQGHNLVKKKVTRAEILGMSVPERIRLAQAIWDSIAEAPESVPLSDADRTELDRRLKTHHKDPQAVSSWREVKRRLSGGE